MILVQKLCCSCQFHSVILFNLGMIKRIWFFCHYSSHYIVDLPNNPQCIEIRQWLGSFSVNFLLCMSDRSDIHTRHIHVSLYTAKISMKILCNPSKFSPFSWQSVRNVLKISKNIILTPLPVSVNSLYMYWFHLLKTSKCSCMSRFPMYKW